MFRLLCIVKPWSREAADRFKSKFSNVVPSPVMGPGHISSIPNDGLTGQNPA